MNRLTIAQIAQSVEQRTENPYVGGSIPPLGTTTYRYYGNSFKITAISACTIFVLHEGVLSITTDFKETKKLLNKPPSQ